MVSWADHDHRGDYAAEGHSHRDYAGLLHRHRHDEAAIERLETALHRAQSRISSLEETIRRLAGALELIAGEHEATWRAGTADEAHAAVAEKLSDAFGWLHRVLDAAGPCPCGCQRKDQDGGNGREGD
jgi:ParB-like chromosome segregation protein Spo0J